MRTRSARPPPAPGCRTGPASSASPTWTIRKAPTNGTRIVPTLPPEMWALMAKPAPVLREMRPTAGRCRPGAAGEAPMRARLIEPSSWPTDCASPPSISAAAEHELSAGEQRGTRHVAGDEAVQQLHRAADGGGDGDEQADVALVERELDDDDRVDQRHQRRLGVDGGVAEREEPQRQAGGRYGRSRWRGARGGAPATGC